ncbi:MauE/DoxX family redox-associated membrane protein [Alteribacillus sp. JSM 102045]|uniref:MauE/DoxX family redox-associated membrane protein n=1 Tax=Alteribacillus sp. JSM 102045 TaxID=1562101 RepID=UPI0035C1292B
MNTDIGIIIVFHIASLFFISAIAKLTSLKQFLQFVLDFNVLPARIAIVFGMLIPFLEFLGAAFLMIEHTHLYGGAILSFLLITFLYAIIHVLQSGEQISCGCYGRWFDFKVNQFTLGKAVYLLFLIIITIIVTPIYNGEYSVFFIVMGMILTLLLLVTEKMWQIHIQTMEHLHKKLK